MAIDPPTATSTDKRTVTVTDQNPGKSEQPAAQRRLYQDAYDLSAMVAGQQSATPEPNFLDMTNPFSISQMSEPSDNLPNDRAMDAAADAGDYNFAQLADIKDRLSRAKYPRIGQAWVGADNLPEDPESSTARHGLFFGSISSFGLRWQKDKDGGESTRLEPIQPVEPNQNNQSSDVRSRLLQKNPNLLMLAEIRYHDAKENQFPQDSQFWLHDPGDKNHDTRSPTDDRVPNSQYSQYDLLNYKDEAFQDHVAAQARAAVASGAVDGVMLDWWNGGNPEDSKAKHELLEKVRKAIGPDALILINTNESQASKEDTQLVNGYYMESYHSKNIQTAADAKTEMTQITDTLAFSEQYGREPHINMVETWPRTSDSELTSLTNPLETEPTVSQSDLRQMRATTTQVMTHSDGFALFADADQNGKTADHQHRWYPFWDANLGEPEGKPDGSSERQFKNGTVVSNALGDLPLAVRFHEQRTRVSDGTVVPANQDTFVDPGDGDIFLK